MEKSLNGKKTLIGKMAIDPFPLEHVQWIPQNTAQSRQTVKALRQRQAGAGQRRCEICKLQLRYRERGGDRWFDNRNCESKLLSSRASSVTQPPTQLESSWYLLSTLLFTQPQQTFLRLNSTSKPNRSVPRLTARRTRQRRGDFAAFERRRLRKGKG